MLPSCLNCNEVILPDKNVDKATPGASMASNCPCWTASEVNTIVALFWVELMMFNKLELKAITSLPLY